MQTQPQKKASAKIVIGLLLVHLVFSTVSIAVKYTSMQEMLSLRYFIGLGIVILILGTYAIVWQQVLKRIDITLAYMFKATGVIFVLLYSVFLFGEPITTWNIIGAAIIVTGITLFVKS
jgi:drug/metabolite transporter (DMT)-like permease